ncbi:MAG: VIT family protein [Actinomycetota bacterium]
MTNSYLEKEASRKALARKLNWLRAGVLGANDGIVSTAGIVMGVAGATTQTGPVLIAGIAALVAGSISMAGGEYASVSAQRDSEVAALKREAEELARDPKGELLELADFYRGRGLSESLAIQVAQELSTQNAIKAHAEAELGISSDEHVSPGAAAISSFVSFALGSVLPILAIAGPWQQHREIATVTAVVLALALTGFFGAKIGGAKPTRAVIRNVFVSLLTMGIAYLIGGALGVAVG